MSLPARPRRASAAGRSACWPRSAGASCSSRSTGSPSSGPMRPAPRRRSSTWLSSSAGPARFCCAPTCSTAASSTSTRRGWCARARGRDRVRRRRVARGRDRPEPAAATLALPAAAVPRPRHRAPPVRGLGGHGAVRRPRPDARDCSSAHAGSPACTRPRSPTSSRRRRTRRARRSSRRSARTRSSRPTSSRSSTTSTRSSSCDERSDEEVAAVLSRMASDDAADLMLEIEQDRRLPGARPAAGRQAAQDQGPAGLQPVDGRRPDEPRLRRPPADATVSLALDRVRASDARSPAHGDRLRHRRGLQTTRAASSSAP